MKATVFVDTLVVSFFKFPHLESYFNFYNVKFELAFFVFCFFFITTNYQSHALVNSCNKTSSEFTENE